MGPDSGECNFCLNSVTACDIYSLYMSDKLVFLNINELQANPFQPREKIKKEDIQDLVASVKRYGILEPLVVAETPAGYQLIAGERRWRAALEAGLKEVPAQVKKTTPKKMLEMALVENVQRSDLNPLEKAQAFQRMIMEYDFSHQEIADVVGKSASYVGYSLRLLKLPDAIKDALTSGVISEGHAKPLTGIEDEAQQVKLFKQIVKEGASVRKAEEMTRLYRQQHAVTTPNLMESPHKIFQEKIDAWRQALQSKLEVKSNFQLVRSKAQTKIVIVLKGNAGRTQEDLEKIVKRLTE